MDLRQRPTGKECYDQCWRIIAFLESSFAFIPCLDGAAEETTLEAKLRTICASMEADKAQQHAAIAENRRLLAYNERLRIDRDKLGYDRDWNVSERKRLSKDNENLRAELRVLKAYSPVVRSSQSDTSVEIPALIAQQNAAANSLQTQLDAAQKGRSALLEQLQEANKDNDRLSDLLQESNNRVDHLIKSPEQINADNAARRSLEDLEHIKEKLLQAQATIDEREYKIASLKEELNQSKSQLSDSKVKVQEVDTENNNLEQRLKLMERSNRQKETQITRLKRNHRQTERDQKEIERLNTEAKEHEDRLLQLADIVDQRDRQIRRLSDNEQRHIREAALTADRLQFAQKEVHDRQHKAKEQGDCLQQLADIVDERDRKIQQLSDSEKQLVHETALATDQLKLALKEAHDRQQEIEMMKISLAYIKLTAEKYREKAETSELKVKELVAELERMKLRHTLEELKWKEFTSREQALTAAVASVVQWKKDMLTKMNSKSVNGQDRAL